MQMARGVGTIRLVALMSQESESVKCNALLVMGNLLRHCEAVHSEFLRLGGIRKLAALFRQAVRPPSHFFSSLLWPLASACNPLFID